MARIYVGSLGYTTTKDAIATAFAPFGAIMDVDMPWDNNTNAHRGYAFVEFFCPEAAAMAIEQMHQQNLDGRPMKVSRPQAALQAGPTVQQLADDPRNATRVYIAGVHPEISEEDIKVSFSPQPTSWCARIPVASQAALLPAVLCARAPAAPARACTPFWRLRTS